MDIIPLVDTFDDLYQRRAQDNARFGQQNTRLRNVAGKAAQAFRDVGQLRGQLDQTSREKYSLQTRVSNLNDQNARLSYDVDNLNSQNVQLKNTSESLRIQNDCITSKVQQLQIESQQAKTLLQKLKKDYYYRLQSAERTIGDFSLRLQDAECTIKELRSKASGYEDEIRDLRETKIANMRRIDELESQNSGYKTIIRELNERLENRAVAIETLAEAVKNKNARLSQLEARNEELERQQQIDRGQLQQYLQQIGSLQNENTGLKEDINLLKYKLANYSKEYKGLQALLGDYDAELGKIEQAGGGGGGFTSPAAAPRAPSVRSIRQPQMEVQGYGWSKRPASRKAKSIGGRSKSSSRRSRGSRRSSRGAANIRTMGDRLELLEQDIRSIKNKI